MSTKIKKSKTTPKYSWGGVLADTAAGAGMGAMAGAPFGGIGALPGAIIGGAGAFLKGAAGEIAGNKQEQFANAQKRVGMATNDFNAMMIGSNQNPFTATFAKGGMIGNINAEIEKGETSVSPDGRMRQFNLPSHAQTTGDNFKFFDPGTMIFSDKLKFSKDKTFAQEQLTYKKISDKAEKTLKNPGSTFLNKKTAGLNKQNSLKMSMDLFGKQEAMKMSKGGSVPGKFPDGGGIPKLPYNGYTSTGVPYPSPESTFAAMMYPYNMGAQGHPINMPQINVNGNAPMVGVPNSMNNPINLPEQFVSADRTNQQYPMRLPQPSMTVNQNSNWVMPGVNARQGYTGYPTQQDMIQNMQANQYAGWRMPGVRDASKPIVNNRRGTGLKSATVDPAANNSRWNDLLYADNFQPVVPNVPNTSALWNKGTGYSQSPDIAGKTLSNMPSYKPNGAQGGNAGMNLGGIGMQALSLAPDIYNLGQALFSKPEKIERSRYFNPYTNQIRSRMNDRRFNIDPILDANRNANAVYNRNVANASGGDRSRLLSNLMGGLNARYGADAGAYAQKNNMDNQYLGEQAEMDFNLGQQNANALAMSDDINARNSAARRNFGASATSGMQQYALNQMQMRNQMNSQNAYLDVLERMNPYNNQWMGIDNLRSYNKKR